MCVLDARKLESGRRTTVREICAAPPALKSRLMRDR